ncbi:hypothetical protein [Phenylobacterium sp. 58.2.17]|uniref:hypothetical protein n=1 Tax=Phenylobacterium sp. 58.2.17 TaxID=2969306 RepID=UPI00226416E7|nr:hypothetical protein [Phenylobacterium sp. 58.2.17]MCX7585057.1 hypothetical protein [Phenylobacterium sp. 58.2.17]
MSEQSFTPGPWEVGVLDAGSATIRASADGELVAECWITRHNRSRANARLIAAAPALLEALKALIPTNVGNPAASIPDDQVLPVDMTVGEVRKALAAISQAEGRDHG